MHVPQEFSSKYSGSHETAHTQFSAASKIDLMPEAGSSICRYCVLSIFRLSSRRKVAVERRVVARAAHAQWIPLSYPNEEENCVCKSSRSIRHVTFWLLDESMFKFSAMSLILRSFCISLWIIFSLHKFYIDGIEWRERKEKWNVLTDWNFSLSFSFSFLIGSVLFFLFVDKNF